MARYAEGTTVSVERSQAEIHLLIAKYGARRFASGYDEDRRMAAIQFDVHDRRVMFRLTLPDPFAQEFTHTSKGKRTEQQRQTAYDAEVRRLWRSLVLVIKAKLDSVASGIESFDEAFLPQIVVPGSDGMTYGDFAVPQLAVAYERDELPPMLPGVSASDVRSVRALGDGRH